VCFAPPDLRLPTAGGSLKHRRQAIDASSTANMAAAGVCGVLVAVLPTATSLVGRPPYMAPEAKRAGA
jgi:hypothetical protein